MRWDDDEREISNDLDNCEDEWKTSYILCFVDRLASANVTPLNAATEWDYYYSKIQPLRISFGTFFLSCISLLFDGQIN